MPLELADYKVKMPSAVKQFWHGGKAGLRTKISGSMGGFTGLFVDIACANGLTRANVLLQDQTVRLPGHFSATQSWDVVVINEGRLIAAIKFDFLLGASFATGAVSCCNEAIVSAIELQATYRKGVFGKCRKPFVGYLMLLEDTPVSRTPVKDISPHFPLLPEYRSASYADHYKIFCEKLIAEGLYTTASVILSPRSATKSGVYSEMSDLTGLKAFVTTLAGHIAMEGHK